MTPNENERFNLAVRKDPVSLDQVYYHDSVKNLLKKFIRENQHPNLLVLAGPTGTGKGSLVRAYIRTLHCQQRQPGETTACGRCSSCRIDPRVAPLQEDIIWIQRGKDVEGGSIKAKVDRALEEATRPTYRQDEPHRDYKVIVIDELQLVPRDVASSLLYSVELKELPPWVIFIAITMSPEVIDPGILQALGDRGTLKTLMPLTEEQLVAYLIREFPQTPLESARYIAQACRGSIRGALSKYAECEAEDPSLSPVSVANTLHFADSATRRRFWESLESGNYQDVYSQWQRLSSYVSSDRLVQQLERDIEASILQKPSTDQLLALNFIFQYLCANRQVSAWQLIRQLLNLRLVNPNQLESNPPSGYETLFSTPLHD